MTDRATEEPILRPVRGILLPGGKSFFPDPGWDYNPGKRWPLWDPHGGLPDCPGGPGFAEGERCLKILPGQKTWKDYGRPDLREVADALRLPAPKLLDSGESKEEAVQILMTSLGLVADKSRIVTTPVGSAIIRADLLEHVVEKRLDARERYGRFILPTLGSPYEVWRTAADGGFRDRYIGLFRGRRDVLVVVQSGPDGGLLWNVMQADDRRINALRVGGLLHGK